MYEHLRLNNVVWNERQMSHSQERPLIFVASESRLSDSSMHDLLCCRGFLVNPKRSRAL